MANFLPGSGGGSSYGLGPPTNTFASNAARNAYAAANPTWLADYNANRFFWIRSGAQIQRRNAAGTGWEQVTAVVEGQRGPGPTEAQIDAAVNASNVDPLIAGYTGAIPGLDIPVSQIPAEVLLEAELTASRILGLIGVTQAELDDFFRGAVVSGSGAGRIVTITQQDGDTIALRLPQATTSGEGGGDGDPVSGAAFSADGATLTLTLQSGTTVEASVPAILRAAGTDQTARDGVASNAEAIGVNLSRIGHLERRGGGTLSLYHLGAGTEQYTQAEFAQLTAQNLTLVGHIDDPELLPDGLFHLLITNGSGGFTIKSQGATLGVFQVNGTRRTARNQLSAGEIQFTFQISAAEMNAIFQDAGRQPITVATVEFQIAMDLPREDAVIAVYHQILVGGGLTPDQAIELQRAGAGVLLARQEAREAGALATAAQERNAGQDTEIEANNLLTRRLSPITRWVRTRDARTILLHWRPRVGIHTTPANSIQFTLGGVRQNITPPEGLPVNDPAGLVLSVDISARNAASITASSDAVAGYVEAQVLYDNVIDTCFIEAVDPPAGAQIVRLANEAAYNAITIKDPNTIYWWP